MNTSIPLALDAADLLALARPDDDEAPPAVSPPRSTEGQRSHAIRVTRTRQPAAIQAERPGRHAAGGPPGSACRAGRWLARPTATRGRKAAAHDTALSRGGQCTAPFGAALASPDIQAIRIPPNAPGTPTLQQQPDRQDSSQIIPGRTA